MHNNNNKNIENVQYKYLTVNFKNDNFKKQFPSIDQRCEILYQIFDSYIKKDSMLDYEKIFDFLAYNFATYKMHFLIAVTNGESVNEFLDYLQDEYENLAGIEIEHKIVSEEIVHNDKILNVSAKIHTLTQDWMVCREKSSLSCYLYDDSPNWVTPRHIKNVYGSAVDYYEFLKLYKRREFLVQLKSFNP